MNAELPDELRSKLERAVGTVPNAPQSDLEARRRGRSAEELARALLETEGYYRSLITLQVSENRATLLIDPGPRFVIRETEVRWTRGAVPMIDLIDDDEDVDGETSAESPPAQGSPDALDEEIIVFPEDELILEETIPEGQYEASGSIPFVYKGNAPDEAVQAKVLAAITDDGDSLQLGSPSRIPEILDGEGRAVVALKESGFAFASADPRLLEIEDVPLVAIDGSDAQLPDGADHTDHQMRIHYHLNPGPKVVLLRQAKLNPISAARQRRLEQLAQAGANADDAIATDADGDADERAARPVVRAREVTALRPGGRTRTREAFVNYLIPWEDGTTYNPALLAEMERRFVDTGVYSNVNVTLDYQPQGELEDRDPTLTKPMGVVVALDDRRRDLKEANLTWSTDDGASLGYYQSRFNRSGRADTLRYGLELGNIDSRIGGDWTLPHFRKVNRTLRLSSYLVNEDTDAYERQAITVSADLNQRLGQNSWYSYGLGIDAGRYVEARFDPITQNAISMDRNLALITLRTAAMIDNSNDLLNPTRGWRAQIGLQPTFVAGEDTVFFLRSEAQASAYLPFGERDRTVLAGRVRVGTIIGGNELTVPSDRLFYSGGGSSVRGYAYQGINPRLPDNTPRGGMSQFETSLEVRQRIREAWQAVAFVDAGATGPDETPNLSNMRYAAGVGVRYLLPFGPIRADVAFPLNKREGDSDFQLYISIGQSF